MEAGYFAFLHFSIDMIFLIAFAFHVGTCLVLHLGVVVQKKYQNKKFNLQ